MPKKRRFRCEYCMWWKSRVRDACGCSLYNAAVAAQRGFAQSLAEARHPTASGAWLNEYGVFADVDGVSIQVGTPEEAMPACELTATMNRISRAMRQRAELDGET